MFTGPDAEALSCNLFASTEGFDLPIIKDKLRIHTFCYSLDSYAKLIDLSTFLLPLVHA